LLDEQRSDELSQLSQKISETHDEIQSIQKSINNDKKQNSNIQSLLKHSAIKNIYEMLINVDLTKTPKFSKIITEADGENLSESIKELNVKFNNSRV
jgi:lysyl-tRNA synthetase class II